MTTSNNGNSARTRLLSLGALAGLALVSSLMIGCKEDPPTTPGLCGNNNELCVTRAALIDTGAAVYAMNCVGCHGEIGEGTRAPNVRNSDYVQGSKERLIVTILHGVSDSIRVNGVYWGGNGMPAWEDALSNHEIAGVLTYFRATLNDTAVTNCAPVSEPPTNCTLTPRSSTDIANDSVAVWEVKAVRDTLSPRPLN